MKLLSGRELFTQLARLYPVELQDAYHLRNDWLHSNLTHAAYNREARELAVVQIAILSVERGEGH